MKNDPLGMEGKICIITGGNRGIGRKLANELAQLGAQVGIITRDGKKGTRAVREIANESNNDQITLFTADLESPKQILKISDEINERYPFINVLINNAAVLLKKRELTEDGIEKTLAINHLGHFLLTNTLFCSLKKARSARIINISSDGHKKADIVLEDLNYNKRHYNGLRAYYQSKLLNILFTYELGFRLQSVANNQITTNTLHPGRVNTQIGKNYNYLYYRLFSKVVRPFISVSEHQGAKTPIYLATSKEVTGISGKYFIDKKIKTSSKLSYNRELQKCVWTLSEDLVNIRSVDYGLGDVIE